ncbi:hypothetical protein M3182_03995 [Mesobacillus maritimus]|uniref:hypothetical protein n=1 Tax=Mesobacillus maritimus TaxID=1643336 RepID=UPI0020409C70|nr:hypothetical protein [Mesobacillus maritimus]MCM3584906.1 hypothetical protein [Mesobacillus maritimus]MCM3670984.1 hypothetical protein [Mesobacillus maritimus]
MKAFNPILIEFLHRSAISNLPDQKREIYQFIVKMENQLEEISLNETQFMSYMIDNSPFKAAAEYFSVDIFFIKKVMDEAQAEIDRIMNKRCNRLKWVDCTDRMKSQHGEKQWSFLFIS